MENQEKQEKIPYAKVAIIIIAIQVLIIFVLIEMLSTNRSYNQEKIDYLIDKVNQIETQEPIVIEQEIDYDKLADTILEKQPFVDKEFGEKFEEATSYFSEKAQDLAKSLNEKLQEKLEEQENQKENETP